MLLLWSSPWGWLDGFRKPTWYAQVLTLIDQASKECGSPIHDFQCTVSTSDLVLPIGLDELIRSVLYLCGLWVSLASRKQRPWRRRSLDLHGHESVHYVPWNVKPHPLLATKKDVVFLMIKLLGASWSHTKIGISIFVSNSATFLSAKTHRWHMRHTTRTMPSVRWPWATWAWVQLLQRFRCWSWLELTWPWRHGALQTTQNKIDNQQFQKVTIRSANKACSINYLEVQGHTTRTVVRHHIGTRASLCCLQSQETSNFFKRFSISWTIQMETWNNPVLRQEIKWTQSLKEQQRENNCNTNPWPTMKTRKQDMERWRGREFQAFKKCYIFSPSSHRGLKRSRDVMLSVLQARLKLLTFVLPKLCDGGHHECVQRILRSCCRNCCSKNEKKRYAKMYMGHWRHCEKWNLAGSIGTAVHGRNRKGRMGRRNTHCCWSS